ncbi:MAG: HAMP domain-containing histidine kinase [Planctomycetes bacterium]|nr:HAMP domain-containing histidine kinase [Planctomycetota bacterium]
MDPTTRTDEPVVRPATDEALGTAWLVRLRWGAVAGQIVTVVIARAGFGLDLAVGTLAGFIAVTAISNLLLALPAARSASWAVSVVLVFDVVALGAMLAASGGASNPFTVFFLVHVALAALLVHPLIAWGIVLLTIAAFGLLFLVPGRGMHHEHGGWSLHLLGMWIAYALAAAFVTYFVGRVSRAIRDRDRSLAEIASLRAQNERLATLSSFSANAAHELGSPLATIGLAAKELARGLVAGTDGIHLASDAELIVAEVVRCRTVLADLSARAGESIGEMPVPVSAQQLVEALRRVLAPADHAQFAVEFADAASRVASVTAPLKLLTQTVHNLVCNGLEANADRREARVELHVEASDQLYLRVRDRGDGFPAELLARIGEPFVTTKAEQGGLGLGLYLARSFARRMGGRLSIRPRVGGGSEVELCLPRRPLPPNP